MPGVLTGVYTPRYDRAVPNKPKTATRAVRVDDELWHAAKTTAEQRDETVSDVIRNALRRYVRTHKGN